jgi:hypothetical protein
MTSQPITVARMMTAEAISAALAWPVAWVKARTRRQGRW